MRRISVAVLVVVLLAVTTALGAEGPTKAQQRAAEPNVTRTAGIGVLGGPQTIQYDPGAPQDVFRTDTGPGDQIVGNRFSGGILTAGAILTAATFFPGNTDGDAVLSVLGPPTGGGDASVLMTIGVGGVVANVFNQVTGLTIPVGADFIIGQYVGTFNGPDSIGMRNASHMGQGFHAVQLNFAAGTATGFVTLPGQNAMIRATGNPLPVELMSFDLE